MGREVVFVLLVVMSLAMLNLWRMTQDTGCPSLNSLLSYWDQSSTWREAWTAVKSVLEKNHL